ncbi:hypothetical protein [Phaeocystidibacter luteus]|uniref:Uncharacterized protein n=1 Tax=Phaeocystidibacter luteus TaxID=911197 RepID=A0A6N6RJU1_9FLAO|nr:hypothetical protein [Phaeocystidibacter luteus]KAB2813970.1 hypothetical protein F8C67_04615 [Phaeocystidibacter luteus]
MDSFRHKSGNVEVHDSFLFLDSKEKRYRRQDSTIFQGWSTSSIVLFLFLVVAPSVYFGFRLDAFESYHQFTALDWAQVVYINVALLTILILSAFVKPKSIEAEHFQTNIPFAKIRKVVLTDQNTCTILTSGWTLLLTGTFSDTSYLMRFDDDEFASFTKWLGSSSLDKKVIIGWSGPTHAQGDIPLNSLDVQFKTGSVKFEGDKLWLSFKKVKQKREKWKELSLLNYWQHHGVAVGRERRLLWIIRACKILIYWVFMLGLIIPGIHEEVKFWSPEWMLIGVGIIALLFLLESSLQFAKSTGFYVRLRDVAFIFEDRYEWHFGLMLDNGLVVFKAFFAVSEDRDALIEFLHQNSDGEAPIDSSYPTQSSHLASE